jgi:3-(3-hydroxy-phenyl)propionate hydroxylase
VLDLSKQHAFARRLVNSGRLSVPATLDGSPLNTPDSAGFECRMRPGAAAVDAPVTLSDGTEGWLLRELGDGFTAIVYGGDAATANALRAQAEGLTLLRILQVQPCEAHAHSTATDSVVDHDGLVAERYDLLPGTVYLLRPDQHVCARWRQASPEALRGALKRGLSILH